MIYSILNEITSKKGDENIPFHEYTLQYTTKMAEAKSGWLRNSIVALCHSIIILIGTILDKNRLGFYGFCVNIITYYVVWKWDLLSLSQNHLIINS